MIRRGEIHRGVVRGTVKRRALPSSFLLPAKGVRRENRRVGENNKEKFHLNFSEGRRDHAR